MAWILDDAAGAGRCRHAWTWTWTRSQPDPRPDPVVHRAPCRRTVRDASWEHQAASENESFRLLRAFALVVPAMLPRRTRLKQSKRHSHQNRLCGSSYMCEQAPQPLIIMLSGSQTQSADLSPCLKNAKLRASCCMHSKGKQLLITRHEFQSLEHARRERM